MQDSDLEWAKLGAHLEVATFALALGDGLANIMGHAMLVVASAKAEETTAVVARPPVATSPVTLGELIPLKGTAAGVAVSEVAGLEAAVAEVASGVIATSPAAVIGGLVDGLFELDGHDVRLQGIDGSACGVYDGTTQSVIHRLKGSDACNNHLSSGEGRAGATKRD